MSELGLDRERLVWMFTQMVRIREFEESVKRTFEEHPGVIRGHTHLADGADAFVTRVGEALSGGAGPNRARSDAMARESWDEKVADIENLLLELKP